MSFICAVLCFFYLFLLIRIFFVFFFFIILFLFFFFFFFLFFFFFFQAEDGIRDLYVTGVQTCALPISAAAAVFRARHHEPAGDGRYLSAARGAARSLLLQVEARLPERRRLEPDSRSHHHTRGTESRARVRSG